MPLKLIVGSDTLAAPLTGIGYYTLHLLRELLKEDPEQLELLFRNGRPLLERQPLAALLDGLEHAAVAGNDAGPWRQRFVRECKVRLRAYPPFYLGAQTMRLALQSRALSSYKGWLQHSTGYIGPRYPGPQVITVHDLSHLRHPETHPRARVEWLNRRLPRATAEAAHVITDSEFVRGELLEAGLVDDPARVTAIPLGFDAGFQPRGEDELEPVLRQWGLLPRRYVLAVATLEPRKNFVRLLDAYCALPDSAVRDCPLVLTGTAGWKNEALRERIAQVRPPHRVIVTGYVARGAVQALMAGAAVFAYPSLYEGFGLPVLEAMASGTPVLTADRSSLQEVAGPAALCVDPTRTEAITDGLQRLLEQPELAHRLAQAGLQRSTEFSWQQCAREHMAVYRQLI